MRFLMTGLILLCCAAGTARAQANLYFSAGWTNNPNGLAACGTTLQNCFADTLVQDTTASPALTLCTGVGMATSCKAQTVVPASWPYGVSHTVSYTAQYYGTTVGTLLNAAAATLSVENLVVQAPGAPSAASGNITVSLMTAPLVGRGWLMMEPSATDVDLTERIGE